MNLNRPLKLEGITVTVGAGIELVVSPFNIKRSKVTGPDRGALRAATSLDSQEAIAAMVHIAGVALRANYPDLTDEQIEDELKIDDLTAILKALGEANAAGEAKAPTPSGAAIQAQQTGTV